MNTVTIKISSDDYNCEISFDRSIIVVKGDSGIGKTAIVDLINENAADVKIDSTYPCIPLTEATWRDLLKSGKNRIYIIDDQTFVETREFASVFKESVKMNNYFVIISRADTLLGGIGTLSYSAQAIYRFVGDGKSHYIEPMYKFEKNPNGVADIDLFLIEDTTSGYEFFKRLVSVECKHSTAGKSSIVADVVKLSKDYKHIFVVVDMAAYGCHMEEFYTVCMRKLKINIIFMPDYECFEELLLQTNLLRDLCLVKAEMADIAKYANRFPSWEKYFGDLLKRATYKSPFAQSHGSGLNSCYTVPCSECNKWKRAKCVSILNGDDKYVDLLRGTKYERLLNYHTD